MNDILNQLRSEWVHVASTLVELGVGGIATLVWFYYRRGIKRADEIAAATAQELESHANWLASHDRQIRDTRAAVGEVRIKVGLGSFPYTE